MESIAVSIERIVCIGSPANGLESVAAAAGIGVQFPRNFAHATTLIPHLFKPTPTTASPSTPPSQHTKIGVHRLNVLRGAGGEYAHPQHGHRQEDGRHGPGRHLAAVAHAFVRVWSHHQRSGQLHIWDRRHLLADTSR